MDSRRAHDLSSVDLKIEYDSYYDSPLDDFLIPCLNQAVSYDRAVGYFSSALLAVVDEAFTNFAERGGKMRLICSPILSSADAETIRDLHPTAMFRSLDSQMQTSIDDGFLADPANLMAKLISIGCLEIRFAIAYTSQPILHKKDGIFRDSHGNEVSFRGSNNETVNGWLENHNSEAFSVFASWKKGDDSERIKQMKDRFEEMWRDEYTGFDIVSAEESLDFLQVRNTDLGLAELKDRVRKWKTDKDSPSQTGADGLYSYQSKVVAHWYESEDKGVVSFATGAGKTRTALEIIRQWRERFIKRVVIVLVPKERLQRQWRDEMKKIPDLADVSVLLVGGMATSQSWKQAISAVTEFTKHRLDGVVIAVMNSASTEAFLDRVAWGRHILVVADEMHNLGAPRYEELLNKLESDEVPVLGLSATPERYRDDETDRLRQVFGQDLRPVVDIRYAQELKVLVPYTYHFETVQLTAEEEQTYQDLTRKIGQLSGSETGISTASPEMTKLVARRANVLKGAAMKIAAAERVIRERFQSGHSWLIFCNDSEQLQILKTQIADLQPLDYYTGMSGDPDETLALFANSGGILLSIHMMDEGVDIPSIDHCLILASSQSKREFIQRRGRVLRSDRKNVKGLANIWDLLVVDGHNKAFADSEADRALEFAGMALNFSVAHEIEKLLS